MSGAPMSHALAVDVGGTKLAAAVVSAAGEIVSQAQLPTPRSPDARVVADALLTVAAAALGGAQVAAIGVGCAGPLDPAGGTVSPVNIPAWREFPILKVLDELAPGRPAALGGDGHCMALAEHRYGGHRYAALLGMVVSTGVGGGLVFGGKVLTGPTGNAGHIGHIVVDQAGPPCPCGGRGCVEALASGPAIAAWAIAQGWRPSAPSGAGRSTPAGADAFAGAGTAASAGAGRVAATGMADARALAQSARAGDPIALRAFDRAGRALAAAVASAAALGDLDAVVIGGGVAQAGELLFEPLRRQLTEFAGMQFVRRVQVQPSRLGSAAGLLGAAALAFDRVAVGMDP